MEMENGQRGLSPMEKPCEEMLSLGTEKSGLREGLLVDII